MSFLRLFIVISLFEVFNIACSATKKAPAKEGIFIDGSGFELPYNIFYPKYSGKEKVPLFIWLHGAGERGNDNISQLIHVVPYLLSDSVQKKFPCIVAVPQCPKDSNWAPVSQFDWTPCKNGEVTAPMIAVMEWIDLLLNDPAVDRSRVYVGGLSMGGFGTLDLIGRRPDWFAAAIPICGGTDPDRVRNFKDVPMWIFHGAKDPVVPVSLSRDLAEALRKAGVQPGYTEYPEGGHDIWNTAIREKELFPWLFAQRKKD